MNFSRVDTRADQGFTLIEILVVILIIGILAAIALPSFLGQRSKAVDAAAKAAVHTAVVAAESYSTDHSGSYAGIEPSTLHEYEATIQTAAGNNAAYISVAEPTEGGKGYIVTAKSTNGDTFSFAKSGSGTVTRSCAIAAGNDKTPCLVGTW